MTKATKDQLAGLIDPLIRDYIDAAIGEAIAKSRIHFKAQASAMETSIAAMDKRHANAELFERQVRSHLGIYVPEAGEG